MSPNRHLGVDPGLPAGNPTPSFWQEPRSRSFRPQDNLPAARDVVIIGSGITGCSVAWHLLNNHVSLNVTILEARDVCSGATGRNGGRINCTAVQDFHKYSEIFGQSSAKEIVRFELAHYESIRKTVESIGPELLSESELRWINAVSAVFTDQEVNAFRSMLKAFEDAFPDLRGHWQVVGRRTMASKYGMPRASGGLVGKAGAAWPYRMIHGIFEHLQTICKERFSIASNTPVLSISRASDSNRPYLLRTKRGTIMAKHVVHCTEGHAAHLLPQLRGIIIPRRGQMTVQGGDQQMLRGRVESFSLTIQGIFSYATTNARTGDIFIGGGDREDRKYSMGRASDAEEDLAALSYLSGVLQVVFGSQRGTMAPRVKSSWSGTLGCSIDDAPLVGMLPQELLERPAGSAISAEWISAGYGGYGMVNAFLCGKYLVEMMLGLPNELGLPRAYLLNSARALDLIERRRIVVGGIGKQAQM
ncbi:uncharacterized protein AB675_6337 [Cyphellophora attinorum]|uniref:FAD dependent oxidoreductase domain-containing protein n=1 Tax=Cyphellophora attinorum TaxID=1664694 RepID=A0A0N0NQR6_9EURO|nr:uncharacterized protein AB675_6337 [Phialophora attinorum]KPI43999.1 hypothetical protein AB675_6337 [Phialophora attinorum]